MSRVAINVRNFVSFSDCRILNEQRRQFLMLKETVFVKFVAFVEYIVPWIWRNACWILFSLTSAAIENFSLLTIAAGQHYQDSNPANNSEP